MLRRPCLALIALLPLVASWSARADMFRGVAAFERGDFAAAMAELVPLAESGDGEAQYYVARMYHRGHIEQDLEAAARWYRRAAEQGHAGAQNNLGVLYEGGLGVAASDEEAARWYRLAAEQSLIVAQVNLAALYEEGRGVERDPGEAVRWYRRAAEAGHARAQYKLGVLIDEGRAGDARPERAAHWYRAAARQGSVDAQLALARLYEEGRGVERSAAKASKWRRRARAQGVQGDFPDEAGAAPLTDEASAAAPPAGEPEPAPEPAVTNEARPAQPSIASEPTVTLPPVAAETEPPLELENLPPDLRELRRLALAGDAGASYELGRRYGTGEGLPESRVEAGRWYLAAAERGHGMAAYLVAFQFFRGHGVAARRDLVQAHLWFSVAAADGVGDAAVWRERVAKKMSPKEREQAEALYAGQRTR